VGTAQVWENMPPSRGAKQADQGQQAGDGSAEQAGQQQQAATATTKAGLLTSKFTGVCWNKKNKRWQASINSGGKCVHLT
jgi:hypothetical protein